MGPDVFLINRIRSNQAHLQLRRPARRVSRVHYPAQVSHSLKLTHFNLVTALSQNQCRQTKSKYTPINDHKTLLLFKFISLSIFITLNKFSPSFSFMFPLTTTTFLLHGSLFYLQSIVFFRLANFCFITYDASLRLLIWYSDYLSV